MAPLDGFALWKNAQPTPRPGRTALKLEPNVVFIGPTGIGRLQTPTLRSAEHLKQSDGVPGAHG
jgi:hypothetical protein